MGLGKIFGDFNNKISDFTGGIVNFSKTGPSPSIEGVTNRVLPDLWKLSFPYSFQIIQTDSPTSGGSSPISGLFKSIGGILGGGTFDEFVLPIAPQELNQVEQFAITITPTQRGIITEHNGIVFKELTIAGTTGQRPKGNFVSGYESFMQLRNYFRSYAELKKDPTQRNMQLIFINRKDNERLIIEPISFTLRRSSKQPFLYNYAITLKVLGLTQPQIFPGIIGDFFNKVSGWAQTAGDIINSVRYKLQYGQNLIKTIRSDFRTQILEPMDTISLAFKKLNGKEYKVSDLPPKIVKQLSNNTVKSILDQAKLLQKNGNKFLVDLALPPNTLKEVQNNGYKALNILPLSALDQIPVSFLTTSEMQLFSQELVLAQNLTQDFYLEYYNTILETTNDAYEKFGFDMSDYNELVGRVNKYSDIETGRIVLNSEYDLLQTFLDTLTALEIILSTDTLFKAPVQDYLNFIRNNYDNNLGIIDPLSVDEIYLPPNKTLEDLAAEFLGTAERWIEIAVVNNLLPPYIDEDSTSTRIKKSGDKIFIPRSRIPGISNIPKSKDILITSELNATEKNMGVDIEIDKNFDFVLDSNNDFGLVSGGKNAAQALILKISLEKGSLKYHPSIGVGLNIGENIRNGMDIRDDITQSILSDPRFENIKDLSFITNNNTVEIKLNVIMKFLRESIPVSFNV